MNNKFTLKFTFLYQIVFWRRILYLKAPKSVQIVFENLLNIVLVIQSGSRVSPAILGKNNTSVWHRKEEQALLEISSGTSDPPENNSSDRLI